MAQLPEPSRVLIVEDDGIIALDLEQTLRDLGLEPCGVATSADQALRLAASSAPDVVLMDIRIQGDRDGIDAAALLGERYDIPVVFLTSHSDEATLARALQTSPYGYLVKPVSAPELLTTLKVARHRSRLERELRARQRWFSTTVSSIGDGVVTSSPDGHVTYVNRAAEMVLGAASEELTGRPVEDVVRFAHGGEATERALAGETIRSGLRRLVRPDGSPRLVSDVLSPVHDGEEVLGTVTVLRDLTEEEALRKRVELADRMTSLATLAAGVAHEVNNPLTVILGSLEELEEQVGAGEVRGGPLAELLEDMRLAGAKVASIIADLRDFSAPSRSHASGHEADVSRVVRWAHRAAAKEVRARASVRAEVPTGLRVRMEETRLGQVVVNLLVNAAQAFKDEDPTTNAIEVGAEELGDDVWITVTDNGPGMSEQTAAMVFEPFFSTKEGEGMGIGLAICHGLVQAAGGELSVATEPGVGSTFTVRLRKVASTPADGPPVADRRLRVLIVDDDELTIRFLSRCLSTHEVTACGSASEALGLLERGEVFDAILVDVYMPQTNGTQLHGTLAARYPTMAQRTALITAGPAAPEDHAVLQEMGALVLFKPFAIDEVQQLVLKLAGG